jgi:TP901 family phage tail tape measure protein
MRTTELLARMRLDASQFDKSLKASQTELQGFARVAGALPGKNVFSGLASDAATLAPALTSMPLALAAVGAALTGVGVAARRAGTDFEASLAKISTLGPEAERTLGRTREAILDTFGSVAVTGSVSDLAEANFLLQSSGRSAEEAITDLRISAEASVAGYTSVTTAVDGLTTVTNAWKESQITTATASDVLFAAVNVGKATFDDIANSIGLVAPLAASAGVRFQEVAAATAVLSNQGLRTSSIMEGLRSAISNILKPTENFRKEYSALATEFGASRLQRDGLLQFLADFEQASGGSRDALNALFSDITGQTAVLGLLKNGGRDAAAALQQMETAAGATGRALNTVNETAKAQEQLIRNQISATWTTFGEALNRFTLPALEAVARALNDISNNAGFAQRDVALLLQKSGSELGTGSKGFDQANALRGVLTQFQDNPQAFLSSVSTEQLAKLVAELNRLQSGGRFQGNARTAISSQVIADLRGELDQRRITDAIATRRAEIAAAANEAAADKAQRDEEAARRRETSTRSADTKAAELRRQREQLIQEAATLTEQLQAKALEALQGTAGALQFTMEKILADGAARLKSGVLGPEAAAALRVQLEQFETLQTQLIEAERAAGDTQAALDRALGQEELPALQTIAARERELQIILDGTTSLEARKRIEAQLTQLAAARGAQTEDLFSLPDPDQIRSRTQEMGDLAQSIATVGDQLGLLPRQAVGALRGIGALVEQGSKLKAAFKPDSGATGLEKIGIGVGIAGGIAALAGSLLSESPEDRQRKEALKANTEAIRALTLRAGDLASSTQSGATVDRISRVFSDPGQLQRILNQGFGATRDVAGTIARAAGVTVSDVQQLAATLGIEINNSLSGLKAFGDALFIADLDAYTNSFAGSLERLQDTITADGITDPIEILRRRIATLTDAQTGFPALASALDGIDVSTAEGRASALERTRALFDQVQSGGVPLSQLGGLSLTDARRQLLDLITSLRDGGTGATGTGGFNETRTITEVTGSRLAGLFSTATQYLSTIAADVAALRSAIIVGTPLPLLPPAIGAFGTSSGGAAIVFTAGSIVINLTLTRELLGADAGQAATLGERFGQSLGESFIGSIDSQLRERQLRQRLLTGDPSLTA